jgi:hypothetical protein
LEGEKIEKTNYVINCTGFSPGNGTDHGVGAALAGVGSSIPDNGQHFNLNIIGVPKGKTADMSNWDRHTVFVSLGATGAVSTKIIVQPNTADPTSFAVIDGNGTDGTAVIAVPYQSYGTLSYNVYATALGKPTGTVFVNGYAEFTDGTYGALDLGSFSLTRKNGTPKALDISDIFRATGYIDLDGSGTLTTGDTTFSNIWVFNIPTLVDYYWNYSNNGLKLMQVRFYQTTSGAWGVQQ